MLISKETWLCLKSWILMILTPAALHPNSMPRFKVCLVRGKMRLTKQDYITRRLTCKDVVVQGNPRVYKALRDQLAAVLDELRRIEAGGSVNDELLDVIEMIAAIMDGMKEENAYGK